MFEINLLNKSGLQYKEKNKFSQASNKTPSKVIKEESLSNQGNNNVKYFYYIVVALVLSLFAYVFFKSTYKYKTNYEDVSPASILSILNTYIEYNKIYAIQSTSDSFQIIKEISEKSDIYLEQALCDSIFNISSYISINRDDKKLYLNFNWYMEDQEGKWNIKKLYESLNSDRSLTARLELFKNNVILVANYNELINLFNVLKRLKIDHSFNYSIELFKKGVKSKNNYYKVLISDYD